jgi:hypothetical protein
VAHVGGLLKFFNSPYVYHIRAPQGGAESR